VVHFETFYKLPKKKKQLYWQEVPEWHSSIQKKYRNVVPESSGSIFALTTD